MGADDPNALAAVEFEVYGQVQDLVVCGSMSMRIDWLSTTGSPGCKIEKCDLTNWEYVAKIAYTDFTIRF
ncbi:hypothetical protein HF086_015448 [Spodoptera exigua]|uniref:Uncharacterized protein n=1 Tax=Spodoptera exigua TaxID=7107 RepID=A0A922SP35_SPOEX|nr:hypothetical protein HF086_015448 [Spodoptera exigua]